MITETITTTSSPNCHSDPDIKRTSSETVLSQSIVKGNLESVRLLIEKLGANVNSELAKTIDSDFTFYPIHLAIWHDLIR